jgi:hypothetical protein
MATNESKLDDFAEELGKLLGTAKAKAEGWLGQRTQIAKSLEGIRDTASKLLSDLGHQAQRIARKGRTVGATRRSAVKRSASSGPLSLSKRRTMSAAARAKISAAQKARWARLRAVEKKK